MAAALLEVGILFLTLALTGALALRLGTSVIPLYVLGGVVVGPHVLGEFTTYGVGPEEPVATLAELGIVLLLFFLGLEFSIDRLLAARDRILKAGTLDLLVNFPLGLAVGLLLGWSVLESLLLAGIVYISSSAIITKSLIDLGWIADPEAEPVLGVLVYEDLAIAFYLAIVSSLVVGAGGGGAETAVDGVAVAIAVALGVLALIAVAARVGSGYLDRWLSVPRGEQFVLRVLGIAVPVAGFALSVGASEAVAAFFVGMGVAETSHIERAERLLTPVRDVLAAVFFVWVGLGTDPAAVFEVAPILLVLVAVSVPGKLYSGFRNGQTWELSGRRSVRVGTALVARGEFSLIIAAVAAASGGGPVLTETIPALAVGYVLVMSILGSLLMERSDWLAGRLGVA
jgi:CPA2 family monovalent cation:H+ antiporter-2